MEIKVTQYGVMKPNSNVYLTFHYGFVAFTIMKNQCNTEWVANKTVNVNLTLHHGFVLFTIIKSQGNTEWGNEEKH